MSKPVARSVQWPERRRYHAATCVNDSVLVMVGGQDEVYNTLTECWTCDTAAILWKEVYISVL